MLLSFHIVLFPFIVVLLLFHIVFPHCSKWFWLRMMEMTGGGNPCVARSPWHVPAPGSYHQDDLVSYQSLSNMTPFNPTYTDGLVKMETGEETPSCQTLTPSLTSPQILPPDTGLSQPHGNYDYTLNNSGYQVCNSTNSSNNTIVNNQSLTELDSYKYATGNLATGCGNASSYGYYGYPSSNSPTNSSLIPGNTGYTSAPPAAYPTSTACLYPQWRSPGGVVQSMGMTGGAGCTGVTTSSPVYPGLISISDSNISSNLNKGNIIYIVLSLKGTGQG